MERYYTHKNHTNNHHLGNHEVLYLGLWGLSFAPPSSYGNMSMTLITSSTSLSLLSASTSSLYPFVNSSPNSAFFPSPNKIAPLGSSLICFQKSGVTDDKSIHEGVVVESVSNGMYLVSLESGNAIIGYVCGKMRQRSIQILPGDKVRIELNRYDSSKGRITYRTTANDDSEKRDVSKNKGGKSKGRRN